MNVKGNQEKKLLNCSKKSVYFIDIDPKNKIGSKIYYRNRNRNRNRNIISYYSLMKLFK